MTPLIATPAFQDFCIHALAILADSAAKGIILLTLAGLITLTLRRASAAARHLVWALALTGLLALPALSLILPKWQLPILPQGSQLATPKPGNIIQASLSTQQSIHDNFQTDAATVRPQISPSTSSPNSSHPMSSVPPSSILPPQASSLHSSLITHHSSLLAPYLILAWVIAAAISLLPLCAGLLLVTRLIRRSHPLDQPPWPVLLRALSNQLSLRRPVRILRANGPAMPMALGILRSTILLPAEAETWSEEKRRAVLLHELAHIRRWDCLTHILTRLAAALHWFNPLAWLALKRLQTERERACDDLVLTAGARPAVYADQLLDIARTMHAQPLTSTAAIPMARKSQLEGRLLAILDATRNRHIVSRHSLAVSIIVLIIITSSLAALQSSGPARRDVNAAVKLISQTSMLQNDYSDRIHRADELVKRHSQAETLPILADWLKVGSNTKRRSAIHIIGELAWDDPALVVQSLRPLMNHSEDITRGMAALTLSYLQDKTATDRILKMLQSDTSAYARRCAAFALGELNDWQSMDALKNAAAAEEHMIRENAQDAVERLQWMKEFEGATGDRAKVAKGIWIIAGSTENQEERISRAMDLIAAADPVTRSEVLRKARTFDAEGKYFFFGAYVLAGKRIAAILGSKTDSARTYSAQLPGSVTIEMLGIAEKKWNGKYTPVWWHPNGERGVNLPDKLENRIADPSVNPEPNEQVYSFALRIQKEKSQQLDWGFELIADKTFLNSKFGYPKVMTEDFNQPPLFIGACLPSENTTCTLRFGVVDGPWETIAVYDNEKKEFTKSEEPTLQIKSIDNAENGQSTVVQYEQQIKAQAFEIVAIKKNGELLQQHGSGVGWNGNHYPFSIFQTRPEEITSFECHTRPYNWVNFQNISLIPDKKTDVQIFVDERNEHETSQTMEDERHHE